MLAACATGVDAVVEPTISVSEPQRVAASEDLFNVAALADLTPGMIAMIRVSPSGIELERAFMMLTPRTPRSAEGTGERIVASLFAGGALVSQTAAADPALLVVESFDERGVVADGEIVRREDRTVSLALPTPRLVDTLQVTVTSTGETETFDVSEVMASYCASAKGEPSCERSGEAPREPLR
jgi:hypothetical protein